MNTQLNIVENMPNAEYHAQKDYISSSFVKGVYKHSVAKALIPLDPTKDSLVQGDRFHTLMEGDDAFNARFEVHSKPDDSEIIANLLDLEWCIKMKLKKKGDKPYTQPASTNYYKNWLEKHTPVASKGKDIVWSDEYDMYAKMKLSIINNRALTDLLFNTYEVTNHKDEVSFFTEEPDEFGLKYRVRPDRYYSTIGNEVGLILDWKSCQDASPRAFKSDFYKFAYDIQAVFYAEKVLGIPAENFFFVAVEKNYPYNSAVYGLDEQTIDVARDKMNVALQRISLYYKEGIDGIENSNQITYL